MGQTWVLLPLPVRLVRVDVTDLSAKSGGADRGALGIRRVGEPTRTSPGLSQGLSRAQARQSPSHAAGAPERLC